MIEFALLITDEPTVLPFFYKNRIKLVTIFCCFRFLSLKLKRFHKQKSQIDLINSHIAFQLVVCSAWLGKQLEVDKQ